jgi:hypothetical protein
VGARIIGTASRMYFSSVICCLTQLILSLLLLHRYCERIVLPGYSSSSSHGKRTS